MVALPLALWASPEVFGNMARGLGDLPSAPFMRLCRGLWRRANGPS